MAEDVVTLARRWIGTPYVHQASRIGAGCDCLGLIRGIWREHHGCEPELPPPYSADWGECGGRELLHQAALRHLLPVAPEAALAGGRCCCSGCARALSPSIWGSSRGWRAVPASSTPITAAAWLRAR